MRPKSQPKSVSENGEPNYGKVRVSARQQQKRDRALKKQREKEAAEAVLGTDCNHYFGIDSVENNILTRICANILSKRKADERRSFAPLRKRLCSGTPLTLPGSLLAKLLNSLWQ